jgi:hypothetical protein
VTLNSYYASTRRVPSTYDVSGDLTELVKAGARVDSTE